MDTVQLIIEISVLLGAITTITLGLKRGLSKDINKVMEMIEKQTELIKQKDKCECKRYLTDFLTTFEKGEYKSEIQILQANETYDHYIKKPEEGGLGGNSWIEDKWNKLMK